MTCRPVGPPFAESPHPIASIGIPSSVFLFLSFFLSCYVMLCSFSSIKPKPVMSTLNSYSVVLSPLLSTPLRSSPLPACLLSSWQVRGVVDEFLALYEAHVLNPLIELDKDIRGEGGGERTRSLEEEKTGGGALAMDTSESHGAEEGGSGDGGGGSSSTSSSCNDHDPLDMVRQMGSEEYIRWSPAARTRALAWLCDEALSAATMNDLVKKVLEAREVVDRKDREVRTGGGGRGGDGRGGVFL